MTNPRRKNITLTCVERDKNVCVYDINYEEKKFTLQFYLRIENDILYLENVDIEGAGPNIFGNTFKTVIKEVAYEFCKEYRTAGIVIKGNRRSVGRTKGKFLNTMRFSFK